MDLILITVLSFSLLVISIIGLAMTLTEEQHTLIAEDKIPQAREGFTGFQVGMTYLGSFSLVVFLAAGTFLAIGTLIKLLA